MTDFDDIDRQRAVLRRSVIVSRFAQLLYSTAWPFVLAALLIVGGVANRAWFLVGAGVLLVVITLPWTIEASRTRVATHAFVTDGELYIDAGRRQLIVTPDDVQRIGVLGANAMHPAWFSVAPHLAIDLRDPLSGKHRRYVLALVDDILLRRLRSAGFTVSDERVK